MSESEFGLGHVRTLRERMAAKRALENGAQTGLPGLSEEAFMAKISNFFPEVAEINENTVSPAVVISMMPVGSQLPDETELMTLSYFRESPLRKTQPPPEWIAFKGRILSTEQQRLLTIRLRDMHLSGIETVGQIRSMDTRALYEQVKPMGRYLAGALKLLFEQPEPSTDLASQ